MLVEFPSVVDAVRSAVEVLEIVAERKANVPEERNSIILFDLRISRTLY